MRKLKLTIPPLIRLKLKTRMFLLTAIVFAGFLFTAIMANSIISTVKIGSPLYQNIIASKSSLEQFSLLKADLSQIRTESVTLVNEPDRDKQDQLKKIISQLTTETNEKFITLLKGTTNEERKIAVVDAQSTWQEFAETMAKELIPAVERGDLAVAKELATNIQKMRFSRFIDQIDGLVEILKLEIAEQEKGTAAIVREKVLMSLGASIMIFLTVFISILLLSRAITLPMLKGIEFAKRVSEGNLAETLEISNRDEIGELADSLNAMTKSLSSMVMRIHKSSFELTEVTTNIHEVSANVTSETELQAEAVRKASESVAEITVSIREVAEGVGTLYSSAQETSSSTMELSASIDEVALKINYLAGSVDAVSASIIEMTTSIRHVGENMQTLMLNSTSTASSIKLMDDSITEVEANATIAAAISQEVLLDAETGRKSVHATIAGMEDISRTSLITSEKINSLSSKAANIGEILEVIDEVTEQTDLLALNAAIIAAQAGEYGKGFAVVAEEIKDLAERTRNSTRLIAEVIKVVQDETEDTVSAIRDTRSSIADGVILTQKSGDALDKIVSGVQNSAAKMIEISEATREQAKESRIINQAMDDVSKMVAQINLATLEQTRGSEVIMNSVEQMKELNYQVKSLTQDQSRVGTIISDSTEKITGMVARFRKACEDQTGFSHRIVNSVNTIEDSNKANLSASHVLKESVSRLTVQVDVLQQEMGGFKTKEFNQEFNGQVKTAPPSA